MLIAVDEESLINSDIANRRKRIMDGQLIDKLGRRIEQQQAEIDRLKGVLNRIYNLNPRCYGIDIFMKCQELAKQALNGESEGK